MKNKWNLKDQTSMTKDREYGTVTNNVSGIWNLTGVGGGSFFIHSTNANDPLKYRRLVSDLITVNSCSPDQGTKKRILPSVWISTHIPTIKLVSTT